MKKLKVIVIDFNGNDTIDRQITTNNMEEMENCCFECLFLLQKKYSEKHREDIMELKKRMELCIEILTQWLVVEKRFLFISGLYDHNEGVVYTSKFTKISALHRRVMKSLDLDNSVWQLPPNSFLVNSLPILLEKIEDL